ncbi:MAG: hypothetical protein A2Y39_02265 [Candidatus Delongbacteria bacterium GWF2_40_14]|nr:MAG: hypothetical protein A2Y39_02265 [Candidatus Delongbacteria bacterium GWF2_40_14]
MRSSVILAVILNCVLLFSGNIIYNPGCESALVSDNIPLWTEELGTAWSQRTTNPVAYEGEAYFFAGTDALDKLTQTIDVREYATEIDAGIQEFLFTGRVRSYDQAPVDQTQIEVEYWDNAQTTKLDFFDSGLKNNTAGWDLVSDQRYAPAGTRYIKIRLTSVRNSGTNNDGYFDDLKLEAIPRPEIVPMELPLSFRLVSSTFNSIDVGDEAVPAFTDVDGDGRLDLMIGRSDGYIRYLTQHAVNSTVFDWIGYYTGYIIGTNASPAFTDLDGDGLNDILVGKSSGWVAYLEQSEVNSTECTFITSSFNSIDVENESAPAFTDFDGDGLIDMLICGGTDYVQHYEQSSHNSTSMILRSSSFNSIYIPSNCTPTFTDLEGDGLIDLLIGDFDGNIRHYEQSAINSTGFSAITHNFNSIDVGDRAAPAFADFDGDGLLDMLVGAYDGTIEHYEQKGTGLYDFGSVKTGESSQLSYFLRANDLKADLSINCPEGYKASITSGSGFVKNLSVSPVNGRISRTIYVNFEPATLGVISGNIVHTSQEAILKNVAVSGIGLPLEIPLNITTEVVGTDLIISWDAVTGATSYKIYSSTDPYGTFTENAITVTNSWTTEYIEPKRFYYVVTVNGGK